MKWAAFNTHPELLDLNPIFWDIWCTKARSWLDKPASNLYTAEKQKQKQTRISSVDTPMQSSSFQHRFQVGHELPNSNFTTTKTCKYPIQTKHPITQKQHSRKRNEQDNGGVTFLCIKGWNSGRKIKGKHWMLEGNLHLLKLGTVPESGKCESWWLHQLWGFGGEVPLLSSLCFWPSFPTKESKWRSCRKRSSYCICVLCLSFCCWFSQNLNCYGLNVLHARVRSLNLFV